MDLQSTRMWCLRTAVEHNGNIDAVMAAAERMMNFIDGAEQASSVSAPIAIVVAEAAVAEPEAEANATEAVVEASTPESHVDPIAACGTALVMSESGTLAEAVPSLEVVNAGEEAVVEATPEEVSEETATDEVVVEAALEEAFEETAADEVVVKAAPEEAFEETATDEVVVEAALEKVSEETASDEVVVEAALEEVSEETASAPVSNEEISQQEPECSNEDKIALLLAAAGQLEAQMRSLAQAISSHPA